MAKQRPVPPGGRKPANTGERQATPVRPPTAPAPPGPRRPTAGDPSDPRPIAIPFIHHPTSDQPVQGQAQWVADSAEPDEEPPTLDHRLPGAGQPGTTQPAGAGPSGNAQQAGAGPSDTAERPAAGQPGPAGPAAPATGEARATPPPRPTGRPMPSPRRMQPQPDNAPTAGHPYPPDQGRSPAPEGPARPVPVRQGGLSGPPDSGFATGLRNGPRAAHPDPAAGLNPNTAHPGPAEGRGNQRSFAHRTDTVGVAKVPPRRPLLPGLELQPMVHVADMPAAVAFYERLGGEINHGDRTGEWVLMQVGTAQIGLVTRPPDPSRGESTVELNFTATMPLDRLEELLRERGVTVVEAAVDPDLGTRLHVETPDGMPVKIHQVEPDLMV